MSYKLNIILSMVIDKKTDIESIDEICASLKEALCFSKEKESKDFDLQISFSSIEKPIKEQISEILNNKN